ncbi:sensor domain-containing diguanylate cyclase [Halodesulfovibrio marinisediminis]|uniref:PAS domain S-box-containing protein/diguanylate cyclase (GGDEF) domain-containing protein n=1 Tax=Halodesulfovibrio marinisediminis DSM 17456 TaxID=1121457 RepID=A0A1N6IGC1_9BACT|nr:GGDEF domain-containing protein [Halodesulfovibrio marinisediminis]SIO31041.1 PAS domain S-box-containing protein/diguanylate cyclase (GGDEF) domain-containing protein [Halodesulfovibrio marinisediminis DSM 17456]
MGTDYSKNILAAITDGIYAVNKERKIFFWNNSAEKLTGYTSAEVLGARCADNLLCHVDAKGTELCSNGCPLEPAIEDGIYSELSGFFHHKSGYRAPVTIKVSPLRNDYGKIIGAVENFSLATTRSTLLIKPEKLDNSPLENKLAELNNEHFNKTSLLSIARRSSQYGFPYGILFADVDNFSYVSKIWNQSVGYDIIKMIGNSLNFGIRTFDTISHWGGERFLIVCPYCNHDELAYLGEKLRMLVENSWFEYEGNFIKVTASIGGAVANHEEEVFSVLQRAKKQMDLCKKNGKNLVRIDS